jgi:hypothetical protein
MFITIREKRLEPASLVGRLHEYGRYGPVDFGSPCEERNWVEEKAEGDVIFYVGT